MPILRLLLLISFASSCSRLAASRRSWWYHSGTAPPAFAVLRRGRQRRGYNIEEPEMVKAFARERTPFQFLSVLVKSTATFCSFTVCSRPLAAQACSLQAGRSLFGFARPAL